MMRRPFAEPADAAFSVMIVTTSPDMCAALEQTIAGLEVRVVHETSLCGATNTARRDDIPVVIATPEVDWRSTIEGFRQAEIDPSVIVLLPGADATTWAAALEYGAFDALPVNSGRDGLRRAICAAYRRTERKRLVRQAVYENPLLRSA